jgi:TonB family protein
MRRYFLISLFLHLGILLILSLTGRVDLRNFYFGRSAVESGFLSVGLLNEGELSAATQAADAFAGAEETDHAGYELIGVEELSSYANPRNSPPKYPALALRNRWQGETILLLSINKNGALAKVDLVQSSGYQILDEAAWQAAQNWRFKSPQRSIQVRFPVKFVLQN